jgi:uncharacterized membrane protein
MAVARSAPARFDAPADPQNLGLLAAAATPAPSSAPAVRSSAERMGWMLAALTVAFWGLRLWVGSALYPPLNIVACVMLLAGLGCVTGAWAAEGRASSILPAVIVGLWAVGFAGYVLLFISATPSYGTDALAFNQHAAELFMKGINPYTSSMAGALDHFGVPEQYHTWTLDGGQVDKLSYPALSFLVYVPALLLGAGMQTAAVVNAGFWLATVALLAVLLPTRARWAAPVIGTLATYVDFAVGGVTDMVFLPFLLLAVWRWDRYGDRGERSMARWIGPVALALAMCTKQTPWFVLPFLVVGVALEARGRGAIGWWRMPARYAAVVAGVFLAVNVPFLLWSPGAFLHGMLVPLTEPTVPAGQGLITLALFQQMGGGLQAFSLAGLAAVPLAILVFTVGYRVCKPALLPLVAIVFFWATRSFASYLMDLLPAALLAGITVRSAGPAALLGWWRKPLLGALCASGVLLAGCVAIALTSPQPLKLQIVGSQSTGQQQSVRQITVRVTNTTDRPARPSFAVLSGQYLTRPWRIVGPARALAAHETRDVTLRAPDQQAMPGLEGGWLLAAFQRKPDAVSTSRPVPASTDRLTLSPQVIAAPVPVGREVRLDVQLRNRLGSAQRKPGVPVSLGQTVYTQDGLLAGETRINGRPVGQSPVGTVTDARGVAHFVIRGETAQPAPVFFQAWVAPSNGVPHAYSQQIAIQFIDPHGRS